MDETISITVNGDGRTVAAGRTVGELLVAFNIEPKIVVVELNGEIIPRSSFDTTLIPQNSNLEIVQMMAGG